VILSGVVDFMIKMGYGGITDFQKMFILNLHKILQNNLKAIKE
jgi:hypothetical protein